LKKQRIQIRRGGTGSPQRSVFFRFEKSVHLQVSRHAAAAERVKASTARSESMKLLNNTLEFMDIKKFLPSGRVQPEKLISGGERPLKRAQKELK
jgi:hypothetical protein